MVKTQDQETQETASLECDFGQASSVSCGPGQASLSSYELGLWMVERRGLLPPVYPGPSQLAPRSALFSGAGESMLNELLQT